MRKMLVFVLAAMILLTSCSNAGADKNYDHDQGTVHNGSTAVFTDDTIYFTAAGQIKYADKASGIGGPLCGKPECLHNDDTCNAYIDFPPRPELSDYDGALFWWETDYKHEAHAYKVNYDGTGREQVRDLEGITTDTGAPDYSFVHRGYMFFSYQTWKVVNGETVWGARILAYDLNSSEEGITVYEKDYGDTVYRPIIQAYENYLYIMLPIGERQWQIEAGMSREEHDPALELYRWNIETRELETLYNGDVPFDTDMGELHIMDDGILISGGIIDYNNPYFLADWDIYRYDFESKEISQYLELNGKGFYSVQMVNGLFVGSMFGDMDRPMISVVDFSGRTILDKEYSPDYMNEYDIRSGFNFYGADEYNLYYHLGGFDGKEDELVVAFPLDGSDPRVVYSWKGED